LRRGTKTLEPENAPSSFPPLQTPSVTFGTVPTTAPFSFLAGEKGDQPSLPKLGAPVVPSPHTFDFLSNSKTEEKEAKKEKEEAAEGKEQEKEAKTSASTSTASLITPPSFGATNTSPSAPAKAFTFNFGTAESSVKWPTFEPATLPVFKPNSGLPPFNLSNVSVLVIFILFFFLVVLFSAYF
jgi:hypothetical protein